MINGRTQEEKIEWLRGSLKDHVYYHHLLFSQKAHCTSHLCILSTEAETAYSYQICIFHLSWKWMIFLKYEDEMHLTWRKGTHLYQELGPALRWTEGSAWVAC